MDLEVELCRGGVIRDGFRGRVIRDGFRGGVMLKVKSLICNFFSAKYSIMGCSINHALTH